MKRDDRSLRWVFLAAATGEAGRHAVRIFLRYSLRLLR